MQPTPRRQAGPITEDGALPPMHTPSPEVPHGPYRPKIRKLGDIIREFQSGDVARTPIEAERMALDDLAGARVSDGPDPDLLKWANKRNQEARRVEDERNNRIPRFVQKAMPGTPTTQAAQNHVFLDGMQNARVDQAPPPERAAAAQQYRKRVAPKPSEMDPSLSPEGRMRAAARQREAARSEEVHGRSVGPSDFSTLAGRRGVADSTPVEQLTPAQRQKRDHQLYQPEVPRLPGTGYEVWDQRLNDGAGGYAMRAPDPSNSVPASHPVQARAAALGIDHTVYGPGEEGQLEADVAAAEARQARMQKSHTQEEVPGGGHKWVANASTNANMDRIRREQFLRHEYAKWEKYNNADENGDGKPDVTFQDYQDAYDEGEGLTHTQRVGQVRDVVTNSHRAHQAADINGAIRDRADQDNTAARLRTPVANVMFMRDLQAANTPEDRIRVALGYHVQNPNLGLGNYAAMAQAGQDEAQAMEVMQQQQAERNKTPVQKSAEDLNRIQRADPAAIQALRDHFKTGNNGNDGSPEQVGAHIANNGGRLAKPLFDKARAGEPLTDDEKEYLRQWTEHQGNGNSGDDYFNWALRMGVDPYDPHAQRIYKETTGKDGLTIWDYAWDLPINPWAR